MMTVEETAASESEMMTIGETAAYLRVPKNTFYDWRRRNVGPRDVRLTIGTIRYRRSDVDDWVTQCQTSK
jgi:excisionase family DNA binding protein